MAVTITEIPEQKTIEVHVTGTLAKEDYEQFVPPVEHMIKQRGKIRLLVLLHDFKGWDAGALWEDIKFDVQHFNDIDRLAIVGENKWQKGMTIFCKPFTTATVQYFDRDQLDEARAWLYAVEPACP